MQQTPTYHSITELQLRKEQLRNDIHKDSSDISKKWKSLFAKPKTTHKKGFNLASFVNTGAGLFDGFMLAWKLYNKFRK